MILGCSLCNLIFAYPLFLLAVDGGTFTALLVALAFHATFQSLYTGVIPSILAEMFPTRVRYTGLSVSYGFAVVLFWRVRCAADLDQPGRGHRHYALAAGLLHQWPAARRAAIAILSMREPLNAPLEGVRDIHRVRPVALPVVIPAHGSALSRPEDKPQPELGHQPLSGSKPGPGLRRGENTGDRFHRMVL